MTQLVKQSQVHQDLLNQFTIADLDELQNILPQVKSSKLKLLIERDLSVARSKLVTRLVNEAHKKSTEKSKEIKIEFVEEEIEIEEEDVEGYIRDNIRGFENKMRSIKSLLVDVHESKIKEALICCGGDEDRTVEALLSSSLPKRPNIPVRRVKKTVKKKAKSSSSGSSGSGTDDSGVSGGPLVDITLPEYQSDIKSFLSARCSILEAEIQIEKNKTAKYIEEINKAKNNSNSTLTNLQGMIDSSEEDSMKTNRLFLAGEYEAIENMEFRLFTFKPERTFANEVSHIHFRVAESEFHRMLVTKTSHKVTEVKYIVSPPLINTFERRRAEMAFHKKVKFKDLKPILAFANVQYNDDKIKEIAENGFKAPVKFTYSPQTASSIIGSSSKVMFFLVLAPAQVDKFGDFTISDTELILPYYIVHYIPMQTVYNNPSDPNSVKGLHQEWENFEKEAKADKFMDDVKKFYQQTLIQKDREVKMGAIDGTAMKSGTDLWFEKVYSKKAEKDEFVLGANEDLPSAISNTSFEFEEVEDPHSAEDVEDEDIDLENLTEEERRMLEEDDDVEMPDSQ